MLDNNIIYIILQYIDPATMSLLWNFKIVVTAVLFRFLLRRRLSQLKWYAVVLLFIGVITTQANALAELDSIDVTSGKLSSHSPQTIFINPLPQRMHPPC